MSTLSEARSRVLWVFCENRTRGDTIRAEDAFKPSCQTIWAQSAVADRHSLRTVVPRVSNPSFQSRGPVFVPSFRFISCARREMSPIRYSRAYCLSANRRAISSLAASRIAW